MSLNITPFACEKTIVTDVDKAKATYTLKSGFKFYDSGRATTKYSCNVCGPLIEDQIYVSNSWICRASHSSAERYCLDCYNDKYNTIKL